MNTREHAEQIHMVLKALPHYQVSMKRAQWFPEHKAQFGTIDPSFRGCLPPGIEQLYAHQAQLLSLTSTVSAVALATGVASGKTYALALPFRIARLKQKQATALCLVSTKALARQWQRRLQAWDPTWRVEIYTGDTEGKKFRLAQADVVIVTPEKLHHGILPQHQLWQTFLGRLHSVILDDCQEYRGVFGSHVALVLRRLQRVLLHYRTTLPLFLLGSALMGNPREHAEHLLAQPVELIDAEQNGSAFGGCLHLLWQPPAYRSLVEETALLLAKIVEQGYRVVVFSHARQSVEKIVDRAYRHLPSHLHQQVRPYRGGYTLDEREETEERLVKEQVQCVVTTRALEVGLEMGKIDVVIIAGFPGSLISYYQQAGRAGRQWQSALCVFVPQVVNALDASFLNHPERLWQAPTESLWLNAYSPALLTMHLRCAAAELPLTLQDERWFGRQMDLLLKELVQNRYLIQDDDHYRAHENIASQVHLRSWGLEVAIWKDDRRNVPPLERTDRYHAVLECYPQAVYYSRAVPYRVTRFEQTRDEVQVERFWGAYETKPFLTTQVDILKEVEATDDGPFRWARGKVRVTHYVVGFGKKRKQANGDQAAFLGREDFPQPYSYSFETNALWMTFAEEWLKPVRQDRVKSVLHAVEHGWLLASPLLIQGDRDEMNGVSVTPHHPQTHQASIFLYEECAGGNGYGERLYSRVRELSTMALSLLEACPCQDGCYHCLQIPYCRYLNENLEKRGAIQLFHRLEKRFL